ncbi:CbiX/SirB N-terminal domain-containing protein [bacterium]|nr:CbiX/SirB N-terminal domain-containing protein [bacterium]
MLPLFFGPSGALTEYLPPRIEALSAKYTDTRFILAECLESPQDNSAALLAEIIQREISSAITAARFSGPAVILTDHGSPLPGVTQVRNRLGAALVKSYPQAKVASMERRDGDQYAFNEPLLETALQSLAEGGEEEIVVALQFLSSGRHAGEKGDIAQICAAVGEKYSRLKTVTTRPIGECTEILQLLERRFREATN